MYSPAVCSSKQKRKATMTDIREIEGHLLKLSINGVEIEMGSPFCTYDGKPTVVVEKYRREKLTPAERKRGLDFLFFLSYGRKKPRTFIGKINAGLYVITFDFCPLFCCPPCPGPVIQKMAFRPPAKATYNFVPFGGDDYRLSLKPATSKYLNLLYRRCQAYTAQLRGFYIDEQKTGNRIACVYARNLSPSPPAHKITLLFSHSNGVDLGLTVGYIVRLSRRLRTDVLAYDYPGYGRSDGTSSETELYAAVERVYDFLTNTLKVPWNQIVAVGTSLGTAATVHLVSTGHQVKGVVLQGGFMSVIRVLCPLRKTTHYMDQFVNVDKIAKIHTPTLIVHGRKDHLFSIKHAETLHDACPGAANIKPFFIAEGQHTDFEEFATYWRRMHQFLHKEIIGDAKPSTPCCLYHPIEMRLRRGDSYGSQSATVGQNEETKRGQEPVVICERCLSILKVSTSTATVSKDDFCTSHVKKL